MEGKRIPKSISALREVAIAGSGSCPWFLKQEIVTKFYAIKIIIPKNISHEKIPEFVHEYQTKVISKFQ